MKWNIGTMLLTWGVTLSMPFAAQAQGGSTDTLRYHEVTAGEIVVRTVHGEISMTSEHDAVISYVRVAPDSAHAWYDELSVASIGPAEERRPDVSSVLGDHFVLRITPNGHVDALATPEFPESLEGITDLRYQFTDFFPPAPPEPLRIGLVWSDTLTLDEHEGDGVRGGTQKVTRFEVVKDSVVGSASVWVVRSDAMIEIRSEEPVPNQPGITLRVTLTGPEENTLVIAKRDGRMIARRRSAELSGQMEYLGAPRAQRFPVRRTYANEISLLEGAAR